MSVRLQPLARSKARTLGAPGRTWVESLPRVLEELAEAWEVRPGRALPGGSASYVCAAETLEGESRVLKIVMPDPDLADEAAALGRARGRGHVLLHAHDPERNALLLERLGPSLEQTALSAEEKLDVLADTLRQAWTVPLDGVARGEDKAVSLAREVVRRFERLDAPCSRRVLEQALLFADRRAGRAAGSCVVVHGDPHPANALRIAEPRPGAESGYVFVDPDGFAGDPAYDLGVVLRDWTARLRETDRPRALLEGYAARLAARTGYDEAAIWEWGFLERVSTGLYVLDFGAERLGREFLDSAELLV